VRVSRRAAFTLIEVIAGTVVLGLLTLVIFSVFSMASTSFQTTSVRLELQAELRKICTDLRREFEQSTYSSVAIASRTVVVLDQPPDPTPTSTVHRDGLCFASLANPQAVGTVDNVTGLTRWDGYTVYSPYWVNSDVSNCKLLRYRVSAHAANTSQSPLGGSAVLSSSYLWPAPTGLIVGTTRTLTARLRSLQVTEDAANQNYSINVAVQGAAGRIATGNKTLAEVVETSLRLIPENTWPRM